MTRRISPRSDPAIIISDAPIAEARDFTARLDAAMRAAGKTSRDLAEALEIRPQWFSSGFLRRDPFIVQLTELDIICGELGVSRAYFLDDDDASAEEDVQSERVDGWRG